jgi:hypothetical protein
MSYATLSLLPALPNDRAATPRNAAAETAPTGGSVVDIEIIDATVFVAVRRMPLRSARCRTLSPRREYATSVVVDSVAVEQLPHLERQKQARANGQNKRYRSALIGLFSSGDG